MPTETTALLTTVLCGALWFGHVETRPISSGGTCETGWVKRQVWHQQWCGIHSGKCDYPTDMCVPQKEAENGC